MRQLRSRIISRNSHLLPSSWIMRRGDTVITSGAGRATDRFLSFWAGGCRFRAKIPSRSIFR